MPLVTVIIATYNRSNIVGYSIQSVLDQTVTDWELLVIGDACTDDTEAVVAAFGDPRIRFENLPVNCGEQTGPNNHALAQARGTYIAFLNHDDLWFPDHLATLLAAIEQTGADLVFPLAAMPLRKLLPGAELEWVLFGAHRSDEFDPDVPVPASLWLHRRELVDRMGPWRYSHECHEMPSRDWIQRAHRAGAVIRPIRALTVTGVVSTAYGPGAYTRRDSWLHDQAAARLHDPRYREDLLVEVAVRAVTGHSVTRAAYALGFAFGRKLLAPFGTTPSRLYFRLRRKGTLIQAVRKYRGLAPLPRQSQR